MGTIVYIDGFDDYLAADATLHGWDEDFSSMEAGRVEGYKARFTQKSPQRSVEADAHYSVTCAMWFNSNVNVIGAICTFYESSTSHGYVSYNGDGTFSVYRGGGTLLGTSGNCAIASDTAFHFEFDYNVHDSTGTYELRINKAVVLSGSGVDTRNGATGVITVVRFTTGTAQTADIDDLLITKGGGFHGDVRVVTDRPDADGANTDWTPTTYAPVFVTSSNSTSTAAGGIVWPAHQVDDVAILLVESAGGEPVTLSTPSGFTELTNSPQATGSGTAGTCIHAYWNRATTTAMGSVTVADPGDHWFAAMLTFRGVIPVGDPIDVTAGAVKTPATTSFSAPTATTTMDGCLVLAAIARDDDVATAEFSAWTNAALSGLAEVFDLGSVSGNGGGIGVATGTLATAGATGATTGTVVSSINASMTIALKPAEAHYGTVADLLGTDQDYISSSTVDERDTFGYPALGVTGTVVAVAVSHVSRKDDAGTRKIATCVRRGGTNYDGTGAEVTTSYLAYQEVYEVDPSTSAAWTVSDIDAGEFGVVLDT